MPSPPVRLRPLGVLRKSAASQHRLRGAPQPSPFRGPTFDGLIGLDAVKTLQQNPQILRKWSDRTELPGRWVNPPCPSRYVVYNRGRLCNTDWNPWPSFPPRADLSGYRGQPPPPVCGRPSSLVGFSGNVGPSGARPVVGPNSVGPGPKALRPYDCSHHERWSKAERSSALQPHPICPRGKGRRVSRTEGCYRLPHRNRRAERRSAGCRAQQRWARAEGSSALRSICVPPCSPGRDSGVAKAP